jgi:leader peptidase (prepilin peptidase) / N-methyltransferase
MVSAEAVGSTMSLAFAIIAAALAAACGWPARAAIATFRAQAGQAAQAAQAAHEIDGQPDVAAQWLTPFLSAVLALTVALRLHPGLVAAAGCWLVVCGVPLAVIDIRVRRLPDLLTGACIAGISVLLTAAAASTAGWPDLTRAGEAGLAVAAFFALLALARPGSAGLGDAKLALSTGALAGWLGWGPLLGSVFAAFVLAALCGLWLVGTRRATLRGTSLPFGPFLLAGCLAVVLLAGVGHGDHVAALL